MTPAVAAVLDGMPEPRDLHRVTADGTTWILAGPAALFSCPQDDAGGGHLAAGVVGARGVGRPARAARQAAGGRRGGGALLAGRRRGGRGDRPQGGGGPVD